MDYKKKYNEAQKWIESIYSELSHEQQMEAEAFFPELKESEDEKIRKELIKALSSIGKRNWGGIDVFESIAWLEKQGEKDSPIQQAYEYGYVEGKRIERKHWLEKQGKQKPTEWSEKDENILEDTKEAVINTWGGDTQDIILEWLESLKQRIGG